MLISPLPILPLTQHSGKLAENQSWGYPGQCGNAEHIRASRPVKAKGLKNLGDGLLDYIEAGPKLRKWYGKGDRPPGKEASQDPEKPEAAPDSILVTDADSPTGELILLQLILARLKVTALVRNASAAQTAYGDYVKPVSGSIDNEERLRQSLKNAQAIICPGKIGALPQALASDRPKHVVLLSGVGAKNDGLLSSIFDGERRVLQDQSREKQLLESNVPLTIIRANKILDTPGGTSDIKLNQGDTEPTGQISREDLAQLLVRALGKRPKGSAVLAIQSAITQQQFKGWNTIFPDIL